jgi:hypothetical protein
MSKQKDMSYRYVIEHYKSIGMDGEEKLKNRFLFLYDTCDEWIKDHNLNEYVDFSEIVLHEVTLDYFADIVRLKEFHNLKLSNDIKVAAYTAYWMIKRKPLFYVKDPDYNLIKENYYLHDVNEWYCLNLMIKMVYDGSVQEESGKENRQRYIEYLDALHYELKYRNTTPQALELSLISLEAVSSIPRLDDNNYGD